jgi:hypothetical protein
MKKVMILFGEFSLFFENKNGTIKWRNMLFEKNKKYFKKMKISFLLQKMHACSHSKAGQIFPW